MNTIKPMAKIAPGGGINASDLPEQGEYILVSGVVKIFELVRITDEQGNATMQVAEPARVIRWN